jgi:hypothetical protein
MEAQELAVLSSMFALAGRYEEAYDYRTQMEVCVRLYIFLYLYIIYIILYTV